MGNDNGNKTNVPVEPVRITEAESKALVDALIPVTREWLKRGAGIDQIAVRLGTVGNGVDALCCVYFAPSTPSVASAEVNNG